MKERGAVLSGVGLADANWRLIATPPANPGVAPVTSKRGRDFRDFAAGRWISPGAGARANLWRPSHLA